MNFSHRMLFCLATMAILVSLAGCLAPLTRVNEAQAENRVYADQNKAQQVEIDSLKANVRDLEGKLVRSEEELAIVQQQAELDRSQLAKYEKEHSELVEQYRIVARDAKMPPSLGKQLQELSRRHPALKYDPETGLSKLDTDILFDSGDAELKPAAERMLTEFTQLMRSPAADGLKIMVVGHTDAQGVGKKPVREKFGDNFQISTARAVAVADHLKKEGLSEQRIGVAGLGASQPIASNATPQERLKNRRVEIFIVPTETPVVGWTDTTPSIYRR
jgi:outer membrane protein OmpA-like peptidoglycan-associated protein